MNTQEREDEEFKQPEKELDKYPDSLTQEQILDSKFFKILALIGQVETLPTPAFIPPLQDPEEDDELDTSSCSFENLEQYLDEVIMPTEENKAIMTEVAKISEWGRTNFEEDFDWNVSLLSIISKLCSTTTFRMETWDQFFPLTKESMLWYTGSVNDLVQTTPIFSAAMLKGLSIYASRSRNEFTISSALFIVFFNYFFTYRPADAWIEPFKIVYEHIDTNSGNWAWKDPELILHRIATVCCGDMNPYLWYEIMLIKTFGEQARGICKLFKYFSMAKYYTLQAMFDTLFPNTLYVALYPQGYINNVLTTWLKVKPEFWTSSRWTTIVFYEVEDVPIPSYYALESEISKLFETLNLESIEYIHAPKSYELNLKKSVPIFKQRDVFKKKSLKRSTPSSSSSEQYKNKLRRQK